MTIKTPLKNLTDESLHQATTPENWTLGRVAWHTVTAMLAIYAKFNALPYHGEADDIGHAVVFLASDESKFMTGQTLQIEGGHYLANPTIADTNNWLASL